MRSAFESSSIGASSFAMDSGPMSTTKAMLVMIVTPRHLAIETRGDEDHDADEDGATHAVSSVVVEQKKKTLNVMARLSEVIMQQERRTNETGIGEEIKSSHQAADQKEPSTLPPPTSGRNNTASSSLDASKNGEDKSSDSLKTLGDSMTVGTTLRKSSQNSEHDEPSPEEAAAVTKVVQAKHDFLFDDVIDNTVPDQQEVNVEELLRITLRRLLEEWHLLTAPSFTGIQQYRPNMNAGSKSNVNSWVQVQFMARPTSLAVVLDRLDRIGIGINVGAVSVYKAELCRTTSPYATQPASEDGTAQTNNGRDGTTPRMMGHRRGNGSSVGGLLSTIPSGAIIEPALNAETTPASSSGPSQETLIERKIEAARMEWKNAATRLRIEQVREQIAEQASVNFDFLALLTIASILAGVGLITDNTVVIVASMLVSPIMGPVLGLTFGSRIHDWPLVRMSFLNESLALFGCVLIGALVGLCSAFTNLARDDWPTNEMVIRGESTGLITGIAIAIPSGMGVCLSILGGNTSSLVGVAISASLLPPAVNAGICFMYSFLLQVDAVENDQRSGSDFAVIGTISFALTALNIVCIWLAGLVMFEIKEVSPAQKMSAFWAKDIKVARELNKGRASKPAPVDVSVLKEGIRSAFAREESGRQLLKSQESEKGVRPTPPASPPTLSTTLEVPTTPPAPQRKAGSDGITSFIRSLWSGGGASQTPDEVVDYDLRYVGLEDIGQLLGFDEEDDCKMDHAAIAANIGKGRYI